MANGSVRFIVYASLGVAVGALVALLDWITVEVFLHAVLAAPPWQQMLAPLIGMLVVAAIRRVWPTAGSSTSDSYLTSYHSGHGSEVSSVGPKLLGSIATIGSGGALGMEGPSVLAGSTMGQWIGDRLPRVLGQRSRLVLVVAGAAAGVAAVFQAPATGVLFALESPYRRDISRHGLVAALIAAASSYLTFVLLLGEKRLLSFDPAEVTFRDEIMAALVLGLLAGLVGRVLAAVFKTAKHLDEWVSFRIRLMGAAAIFSGGLALTLELVEEPLTLGLGAETAVAVILDPAVTIWAICVLFALRVLATSATLSLGGVGGLFIPLVVQGLLLGRAVEILFDAPSTGLFPVIGLAAVLGSAYRTPLAAIVFVAETTGRAEFVIPALIATAISQALMGDRSVSDVQRGERATKLERNLAEACINLMEPDDLVLDPETSIADVVDQLEDRGEITGIAVGAPGYQGLLVLHDLAGVIMAEGVDASVAAAMRDVPAVRHDAPAEEAARLMNDYDTAVVAVVDSSNRPVGVITPLSLAGLHQLV